MTVSETASATASCSSGAAPDAAANAVTWARIWRAVCGTAGSVQQACWSAVLTISSISLSCPNARERAVGQLTRRLITASG